MNVEAILSELSCVASRYGADVEIDGSSIRLSPIYVKDMSNLIHDLEIDGKVVRLGFAIGDSRLSSETTATCLAAGVDSGFSYTQIFASLASGKASQSISADKAFKAVQELINISPSGGKILLYAILPKVLKPDNSAWWIALARFNYTPFPVRVVGDSLRVYVDKFEDVQMFYQACVGHGLRVVFRGVAINYKLLSREANMIIMRCGYINPIMDFEQFARYVTETSSCSEQLWPELFQCYAELPVSPKYAFDIVKVEDAVDTCEFRYTFGQAVSKFGEDNVAVLCHSDVPYISTNAHIACELSTSVLDSPHAINRLVMFRHWDDSDLSDLFELWSHIGPACMIRRPIEYKYGCVPTCSQTAKGLNFFGGNDHEQ